MKAGEEEKGGEQSKAALPMAVGTGEAGCRGNIMAGKRTAHSPIQCGMEKCSRMLQAEEAVMKEAHDLMAIGWS